MLNENKTNVELTKEEQEIVMRVFKRFEALFTPDESFEDALARIRKMRRQDRMRELFEDGEEE